MSEGSPRYIYDYMAEMFFLLPGDGKTLHHRYITYYEKLKGYGRGFKSQDFDKFNLKAWAIVPISNNEKLDMSVYLSKNNEIEDFRMQYRAILDQRLLGDPTKEVLLPLKNGYTQRDIHSLQIRTDYGHQNKQGKIKHTNIDLYDVFNNKINMNDEKSFIQQDFNIPHYEWAIHYVLMQVEKFNQLIGPQFWLSPFGIHENRVNVIHKLWQESRSSIPLCVLSKNVYTRMIEKITKGRKELSETDFEEIVRNEIDSAMKIENPDNSILVQLESQDDIYLLPFPFFVPEESFRYGSVRYMEDGSIKSEDSFEDMGLIFGKSIQGERTTGYSTIK